MCEPPVFSHRLYSEAFCSFKLRVPRLSEYYDELPVMASQRLMQKQLKIGDRIAISGQIRSYNRFIDGASRLILTVFARSMDFNPGSTENPNCVYLRGHICKEPVYRTTPFNREITDILLAVNRAYNKSDYIPLIAWGRNARFARTLHTGDEIAVSGRMQSRDYEKIQPDGTKKIKTAYEVSISAIGTVRA